jgi:hypothetical protein
LEKQAILNFLLKTKYMKHPRFKLQFFMRINLQFHTSILGWHSFRVILSLWLIRPILVNLG